MNRPALTDLPPRFHEQVRQQLAQAAKGRVSAHPAAILAPARPLAKPTLRQSRSDNMNKWEREFLAYLQSDRPNASIHREVSLPLANGLRYKVDFVVASKIMDTGAALVGAFEVKGRRLPAGIAKLKMAARLYPWISFHIVTKRNGAFVTERVFA